LCKPQLRRHCDTRQAFPEIPLLANEVSKVVTCVPSKHDVLVLCHISGRVCKIIRQTDWQMSTLAEVLQNRELITISSEISRKPNFR